MHDLNSGYATLYNRKYRRSGALFRGRLQPVALSSNNGFSAKELNRIRRLIVENLELILETWDEHRTREYWTGLFAHGFGLCGTTHSQWIAEFEARFGHNRARGVGVEGHNSFEVLLAGGKYGETFVFWGRNYNTPGPTPTARTKGGTVARGSAGPARKPRYGTFQRAKTCERVGSSSSRFHS